MKKAVKGFIVGMIITTLLMSTVLGSNVKETIEVAFDSINLTVNNKKVDVPNILYEGTTYVPIRAVGEMLDKKVGWNSDSRTASINDKPKTDNKQPEIDNEINHIDQYKDKVGVSLDASDIQYNVSNNLDRKFIISGKATLSDYYNFGYWDAEDDYFSVRIKTKGASGRYLLSDNWTLYFNRNSHNRLFEALKRGEQYIVGTGVIKSSMYEINQGHLGEGLDFQIIKK